jgi:hypothetical protein
VNKLDVFAAEREKWRNFPRVRPSGIVVPGPGQESVWDYPRPPRVESVSRRVRVEFAGRVLAETTRALRVCETSSPPVYYIPPTDVDLAALVPTVRASICEWKGTVLGGPGQRSHGHGRRLELPRAGCRLRGHP